MGYYVSRAVAGCVQGRWVGLFVVLALACGAGVCPAVSAQTPVVCECDCDLGPVVDGLATVSAGVAVVATGVAEGVLQEGVVATVAVSQVLQLETVSARAGEIVSGVAGVDAGLGVVSDTVGLAGDGVAGLAYTGYGMSALLVALVALLIVLVVLSVLR